MSTAVIGIGNIGSAVARNLVAGGEEVLVAGRSADTAAQVAQDTGAMAAGSVGEAIAAADAVVFAVGFDVIQELVEEHQDVLVGKVVIDPSNAIRPADGGGFENILADGTSAGSVVAGLLPGGAHFVKAFGSTAAGTLVGAANAAPEVVLFTPPMTRRRRPSPRDSLLRRALRRSRPAASLRQGGSR
jgi:predicted dinucleotide-binding enzyme